MTASAFTRSLGADSAPAPQQASGHFVPQAPGTTRPGGVRFQVNPSAMNTHGGQIGMPANLRQAIADRRGRRRGGFGPGFNPYGYGYGYGYPYAVITAGTLLRCVAPSGCYLRAQNQTGTLVPTGIVVDTSAAVLAVQSIPGPKTDPSSPSPGGWTRVRFSPRTGGTYDGWLPSEWLVRA